MFDRTVKRGATTLLNAMANLDRRRFVMTEALAGELPHGVVIAVTEEDVPEVLRLLKPWFRKHGLDHPDSPAPSRAPEGGTDHTTKEE